MAAVDYKNAKLIAETSNISEGKVAWQSPSNIAIVKYWGKHGLQLPNNPSFSFTLEQAVSETSITYRPKKGSDPGIELSFSFHGQPKPAFAEKIRKYFSGLTEYFPFIKQFHFEIESKNSFPHSAGIASSASGMSVLALGLCSIEHQLFGSLEDDGVFRRKASYLARLGSGSACRSIYPTAAIWGAASEIPNSSDLYAIPFHEQIHESFQTIQDTILLISKSEKAVSSRAGHQLMEGNIYAENRYKQARDNMSLLLPALKKGDWELFGRITESEAMTLHALMMTSSPPYILMQPNTLEAIQRIIEYRNTEKIPVYYTLDAGPNIHLLYPASEKEKVQHFIEAQLAPLCTDGKYINDQAGAGPKEL
jgi:diphosphomevalonate decarboxylase